MDWQQVNDTIQQIMNAGSLDEVNRICMEICHESGFEYCLYAVNHSSVTGSAQERYFTTNYPEEWMRRYLEQNYETVDPTVQHCSHSTIPLIWTPPEKAAAKKLSRQEKKFINEAHDFGLAQGISIPVHGANGEHAIFSLVLRPEKAAELRHISEKIYVFQILTPYIHERVQQLTVSNVPQQHVHLTARERECLLWAAAGKTAWESARILNVSERTVIFHLHNALHKLDVTNKPHAIAKAVALGLIRPE